MHAHGLDLKKIGALLRIQNLKQRGRPAPQYDLPQPNPSITRRMAEVLVSAHFARVADASGPLGLGPHSLRPHRARICFRERSLERSAAKKISKNSALPNGEANIYLDKRRSRFGRGGGGCSGRCCLLIMLWRIGPEKCWSAVSGADFLWFLAACLLSIPSIAVKGLRWQWILRTVGFRSTFAESTSVYAAGMLAGAVTPGKVGDLAKAPLLVSRGLPLTDGVAASLLDRVFDGVVFWRSDWPAFLPCRACRAGRLSPGRPWPPSASPSRRHIFFAIHSPMPCA